MQKTHKLAYSKLEKDLERAVDFVVRNLTSNEFRANNDMQISWTQTAMLLNICNAFREIPQLPKAMAMIARGKPTNVNEGVANNLSIRDQKRCRAQREEDFLRTLWQLVTPTPDREGKDLAPPSESASTRVMTDVLKLLYDPYISGISLKAEAFDQKVELTVEYIREVRRLIDPEGDKPDQIEDDVVSQVRWLILELRDLTDNYLSFRIASKGLKIPSTRDVKVWQDAMREYTFQPNCRQTAARNRELSRPKKAMTAFQNPNAPGAFNF